MYIVNLCSKSINLYHVYVYLILIHVCSLHKKYLSEHVGKYIPNVYIMEGNIAISPF